MWFNDGNYKFMGYSDEAKTLRGNRLGSKILEGFVKSRKIN